MPAIGRKINEHWYGVVTYDIIEDVAALLNRVFAGWVCSVTTVNSVQRSHPRVELRTDCRFFPYTDQDAIPFRVSEEKPQYGFRGIYFTLGNWVYGVTAHKDVTDAERYLHPHVTRYGGDYRSNYYLTFERNDTLMMEFTSGSKDEHVSIIARERPDTRYSILREWVTEPTRQLAYEIQETKNYHLLPRLGKYLQNTGCNKPMVLNRLADEKGTWIPELVTWAGLVRNDGLDM